MGIVKRCSHFEQQMKVRIANEANLVADTEYPKTGYRV